MLVRVAKYIAPFNARAFSSKVRHDSSRPRYVDDTRQVELRGTFLKGNYEDLPTMIFFPEACDSTLNWSAFFTDPDNQFLEYRNIYLMYPRNFGNSDRHPSFDLEDMANDVVRFMYDRKISTATFGGHGFGAKVALAVGCYHAERVTGVFGIDSTPMDQRFHEPFQEFAGYVKDLANLEVAHGDRGYIERSISQRVADPKWRKIFSGQLGRVGDKHEWGFAMQYLNHNLTFNKADSIGNWASKHGLFTGRSFFIFPEYSRWVLLATNTLPMLKVCVQNQGYGKDIIAVQGEENPNNHWVYDSPEQFTFARKLMQWIRMKDGVHVLLSNRDAIGKEFIPDRMNSRKDADWLYSDYSPAHLHHNWRFSNVYDVSKQYAAPSTTNTETTKTK